jgi:serine/threonine-protein kinase
MGEVYRATDTNLKRAVAIKVLPTQLAGDADRLQRFQREAEVLASLNHPNIAIIHGLEKSDSVTGLVMELVDGPTLADRIAHGPISIDDALPIAQQIAEALEAAHDLGIVHRDLKPANIKVRPEGTVKVLDFGLAKAHEPMAVRGADATASPTFTSPAVTGVGVVLGTAAYMSPEQARGKPVDKRTDIWAFGCVLYEMLTGKRAFGVGDVTEIVVSAVSDEPSWQALPPDTPDAVRRLLRRCLTKDPKLRLRDLGDAQIDLQEALTATTVEESGTQVNTPARAGRRVVPWLATVAIAAITGGLAVWTVTRPADPPAAIERLMIGLPSTAPLAGSNRADAFTATRSFAVSPDGRTLVYIGRGEDATLSRLYVRSLDAFEPRPLDGTEGASAPFFSPDGRSVGFFASGRLKRVSLSSGGVATICDAFEDTGGSGGTWGPDDTIVFAGPTSARAGLFLVSASGGTPMALTTPDPMQEGGHGDPAFIGSTRTVLFTTRLTKAGVSPTVTAVSLTTGQRYQLIGDDLSKMMASQSLTAAATPAINKPVYTATGHLVYRRGRTLLAATFNPDTVSVTGPQVPLIEDLSDFDVSLGGRIVYLATRPYGGQLVWVNRQGTIESTIEPDKRFGRPRLSPDGHRLAVEVLREGRSDIGVYGFDSGILTLLTTDGVSNSPSWDLDGRHIVFRAPGGLARQLWDGTSPAEMLLAASDPALHSTSSLAPGTFSPAKRTTYFFVVHASSQTSADIFALHLEDRRIEPLVQRPANQWAVRVSPDGEWLSYSSDESGKFEIYLEPAVTGHGKYQVSNDGGEEAVWSSSGRELFYRAGNRMMATPVTHKPGSPVGAPHVLFTGQFEQTALPQYDVTPDGQRFVMVKPTIDDLATRTLRTVEGLLDGTTRLQPASR